ncbi:sensory transduction protein LytR [Clostridium saccharobutylicum]|uniref:LytR/AlgR family response regulator transcription factor n=1 Tax=Clostridium saccharobutylicum TaxID=169679 RepID=UPI000983AB59|nr:LytTR family DNA-binding domain-containing protein [Clostridium saccharobutylicum]AQR98565.1 sensory transduction protein LytR [Clostridium saccharobutylicum]AQS12555.1 sensory transduction protein LytR [Clostridium saccharobutylicum]
MYSIILVEDEPLQRRVLKKLIISINESLKIYEADSESTALDIIKNNDINMFLIDIHLKESSGLDLAIKIRSILKYEFRQMIFLTTNVNYITEAFKRTHCYDYIIKPYDYKVVQDMISKIILNETNNLNNKNNNLKEDEIIITLKKGSYLKIKTKDIIFIEVKGNNCEVNTTNGIYIANRMSLKKIMKLINCDYIIQSHRGFVVNINYICKIERLDGKLSMIYFDEYDRTAFLGDKFKDIIISEFRREKLIIC